MVLELTNRLVFNGQDVGFRATYHKGEIGNRINTFDISKEDVVLIKEDFDIRVVWQLKQPITLVEQGSQLVPSKGVNIQEMTYGKFAKLLGYDHLEKTDTELKTLYNEYNKKCFYAKLPPLVAVEWSTRMTRGAGVCRTETNRKTGKKIVTIRLSTHYHQKYTDEVLDTLVHEMIHVYHPNEGHGTYFKQTMFRLNREFGFNLTIHATGKAKVNYVYACRDCGQEYERIKRINTNTSRCGAGRCRGNLYLKDDYTDNDFDETDWGANVDW